MLIAFCLLAPLTTFAQREASVSLDGEWAFRFSPDDTGVAERWSEAPAGFDRRITVPGLSLIHI